MSVYRVAVRRHNHEALGKHLNYGHGGQAVPGRRIVPRSTPVRSHSTVAKH